MREALVKAAVFCLQSLKWAAGRAGSKIGPRCGPRYGAVSFCGNQNGLQKGAVGGLRQRVGAPLRVASPESSAALGQAAAEALRVATVKAPDAWLRFASLCVAQDSGPLVGRPAQRSVMLLWQQRALECAAGPQFAVGHSRTSRYSSRYSSREFGSLIPSR